jgi:hypothetical protein
MKATARTNGLPLLGALLLLTAIHSLPAAAQDCSEFDKAKDATMAAADSLDAQEARYKEAQRAPRYDAAVCDAARHLKEQAAAAAALATANCDPKHTVDAINKMQSSADSDIGVFCTREPAAAAPGEQEEPTAGKPYYYVDDTRPPDAFLALRTMPTASRGQRIMKMPNGTLLNVLDRQNNGWWHVRVVPGGEEGWALRGQGSRVWIHCCTSGPN